MEHEKPSIKPIAYTYGVYLALLTIAGIVILFVLNEQQNWIISLISFLITIVVYYYGISKYKKENANVLSLKDALKVGMGMAVISGVIAAIYAVIHYGIVAPEFVDGIKEKAMDDMMSQNPNMEGEALEMGTKMIDMFTSKFFMATMFLISSLLFGFIISLITGAIMKNDK
jgi:preprotein translocase subunit YajC